MIESENFSYVMKEHQEAVIRWRERVQAFESSGMTQKAWCQENQVNLTSFSIWKKRLQETDQEATKNELVDISFALNPQASVMQKPEVSEWKTSIVATIELKWANIHIYEGASAGTLRSIMEAIGNA